MRTVTCGLLLFLTLSPSAFAQRDLKNIPVPDPEEERKTFQVADGFEVNLFAADPLMAKPIQMNFDPQGRLWIVSSEVYPQIEPGQTANDKVLILEDTDGDGAADKTTVFADGLLIPTGIEPGDGGAYVANSTELLHFRDTDGDGKADQKRTVLSGFGTEDTHHILHTLRWGPEGLLYFNQSIYIHSHIETPYGVKRLGGGGIWQFRPETLRLEVFARGWINTWGHQLDDYGQSFVTDGAGGEGINYAVPGAAYPTAVGVPKILHGLNPGSPKYCGLEIVGGRHLPDDWQGNLLTNDFRGHRVCRFVVSDDGAGYVSKPMPDLIRSSHVAFRPIDIKMGPDGAIYIADWYNPIIQHGEVDFRDPRRDHTHGRIWRVTAKGRPLVARQDLTKLSTPELLEILTTPESWKRQQARRVLRERHREHDILPDVKTWLAELDAGDRLVDHHRLEALWLHQAVDVENAELLNQTLSSADPRVRAAAVRVVPHWQEGDISLSAGRTGSIPRSDVLGLLERAVADEHPRVRLEAVRALGSVRDSRAFELALRALDRPTDTWIDYALWLTMRELQPVWLPALEAGTLDFAGPPRHLTFALEAAGSPGVVKSLVDLVRSGKLADAEAGNALRLIASLGTADDMRLILDLAVANGTPAARRSSLLTALVDASSRRNVRPAGDLSRIATLFESEDEALRIAAARAAGAWKIGGAAPQLSQIAGAASESAALRRAAIEGLAGMESPESAQTLAIVSTSDAPLEIRTAAIAALASRNAALAAEKAIVLLSKIPADADPTPVYAAFLQRKEGAATLAAAMAGATLESDVAKLGLRAIDASGRPEPKLASALRTAAGLSGEPKPLTADEMSAFVREIAERGDPARGQAIFRRADLTCQKCHAIGGAGGLVGPDLISLGASAQVDYLIDSLLLPNKQVKENYQTLVVVTDEGTVITGIKLRQTDTDLILRDAEDREIAVPLASIEEQATGASMMPGGLTDKLTRGEIIDLVRFLSELGRTPAFSIDSAPVVRTWRVRASEGKLLRGADAVVVNAPGAAWNAVYSRVDGRLPLGDLPRLTIRDTSFGVEREIALVQFQFDVTAAGPVAFDFGSAAGLKLWLDGQPVAADGRVTLTPEAGRHTLTVMVELGERTDDLRVELQEVEGSAARARLVVGK